MIGRDSPVNNADWSTSNANEKETFVAVAVALTIATSRGSTS